jgi:hypothetical protein
MSAPAATKPLSYSLRTAVEATGLSRTHLNDAINRGELPARRSSKSDKGEPQGKWVILSADLEAYLASLPKG